MLITVRIVTWIARIAGVGALLLGLTFWIAGINLTPIHMLFGMLLSLSFLILGILMLFVRGMRALGAASIVYALIVPVFGMTQTGLLVGDLHWLIRTAHLLVGLGALTLIQIIYTRYLRLTQPLGEQKASAQAGR